MRKSFWDKGQFYFREQGAETLPLVGPNNAGNHLSWDPKQSSAHV